MELILEALLQLLGELCLQVFFELAVELGYHRLAETLRERSRNPVLATIGFVIWGGIAGGISLLIFPYSVVTDPTFRQLNLVVTPLLAGFVMTAIGRLRARKGQDLVRLDRFGYAFAFALSMATVRFIWAG
jgi:hypothetical protein